MKFGHYQGHTSFTIYQYYIFSEDEWEFDTNELAAIFWLQNWFCFV